MLVSTIDDTIKVRGLTQIQAAEIVGIDQPTLSKLLRGRFRSISIDKLAEMLNALGRDATIVVKAMPLREDTRGCEMIRSASWPQHDCLKERWGVVLLW